jgi:hypothetical protein
MPNGLHHLANANGLRVVDVQYLGGLFSRFGSLVNTYVLGPIMRVCFCRGLAAALVTCSNAAFLCADVVVPRPLLAESYCAVLEVPSNA